MRTLLLILLTCLPSLADRRAMLEAKTPTVSDITQLTTLKQWFSMSSNKVFSRSAADSWPAAGTGNPGPRRTFKELTSHQALNIAHTDCTVMASFRLPLESAATTLYVLSRINENYTGPAYQQWRLGLYIEPGNKRWLSYWWADPIGGTFGTLATPWTSNTWYFLAFRFTNSTRIGSLWVNGSYAGMDGNGMQIDFPADDTGAGVVSQLLQVGVDCRVILSTLGMARSCLSDAELATLYNSGAGCQYESVPPLTQNKFSGYWETFRMPGTSGTNVFWSDRTTNGIDFHSSTNIQADALGVPFPQPDYPPAMGDGWITAAIATNEPVLCVTSSFNATRLEQTNFGLRPCWLRSLYGGQDYLEFNSLASMFCAPVPIENRMSVFAVVATCPATNEFQSLIATTNGSTQFGFAFGAPTFSTGGDPFWGGGTVALATNTPTIIEYGWVGTAGFVRVNNGAAVSGTGQAIAGSLAIVGEQLCPFSGRLSDLIIVSNPSTTPAYEAQRLGIVRYLQAKHRL